ATPLKSAYVPTIITAASLFVCRFGLPSVSINEGTLNSAKFDQVPLIRFRKSLTTIVEPKVGTLRELNRARERTMLVINSASLSGVLQKMQLDYDDDPAALPW